MYWCNPLGFVCCYMECTTKSLWICKRRQGKCSLESIDGGESWKNLINQKGLPGRLLLEILGSCISASKPERVFALIESSKGGLFRSDDAGETWSLVSTDANIRQRAWYFSKIKPAAPKNEDVVYALNVGMYKKQRWGKQTFKLISLMVIITTCGYIRKFRKDDCCK